MLNGELVKTITSDGIELQGFWIDRKSDIALYHSHGTAGDFYSHNFIDAIGEKISSEGFSFLTANNRGHDVYTYLRKHTDERIKWTQIGGAFERFEDCILDISSWIDFLKAHGVKKVILQGHSLCQKLVYYQYMKSDQRVIGQIYLSPGNDAGLMLSALGKEKYQKTNKMINKMIEEGREKEMLPKELALVCPMAAIAYHGYLTEESVGNIFPYHNPNSKKWESLSKIEDPLLIIFGEADSLIKPSIEEATRLFNEKTKSLKKVDVEIIKKANHSFIGHENELSNIINSWIKQLI
jgi:alpha-beta hydrolase superfamily lysophospholipase